MITFTGNEVLYFLRLLFLSFFVSCRVTTEGGPLIGLLLCLVILWLVWLINGMESFQTYEPINGQQSLGNTKILFFLLFLFFYQDSAMYDFISRLSISNTNSPSVIRDINRVYPIHLKITINCACLKVSGLWWILERYKK